MAVTKHKIVIVLWDNRSILAERANVTIEIHITTTNPQDQESKDSNNSNTLSPQYTLLLVGL